MSHRLENYSFHSSDAQLTWELNKPWVLHFIPWRRSVGWHPAVFSPLDLPLSISVFIPPSSLKRPLSPQPSPIYTFLLSHSTHTFVPPCIKFCYKGYKVFFFFTKNSKYSNKHFLIARYLSKYIHFSSVNLLFSLFISAVLSCVAHII